MKKLSKIVLRTEAEALNKEEMKLILGGTVYRCCCGIGSDVNCYNVYNAENSEAAVYGLSYLCANGLGGCGIK